MVVCDRSLGSGLNLLGADDGGSVSSFRLADKEAAGSTIASRRSSMLISDARRGDCDSDASGRSSFKNKGREAEDTGSSRRSSLKQKKLSRGETDDASAVASRRSSFKLGGSAFGEPGSSIASRRSSSKLHIDAMFDDSRGHGAGGRRASVTRQSSRASSMRNGNHPLFEADENTYCQDRLNFSVHDRIEKMFSDMTMNATGPVNDRIGAHSFTVDYLGSTPLLQKVTSLSGLQAPLRNLYFAYRKNIRHNTALTGRLEISKSGLKVRYQGDRGDLEQLNPFPTIAVWSAVKFVVQSAEGEANVMQYAFLPLITDPDNIDKKLLFRVLDSSEKKYILSHSENAHSPLFAVVMRKIGVAKQLECHGFVCQTSEDAIVIAATLYKSLMSHMSQQNSLGSMTSKKKLPHRNGINCMSITNGIGNQPDLPVRPPRKKRSTSSTSGDSDAPDLMELNMKDNFRGSQKNKNSIIHQELPPLPVANKIASVEEVKAKLDTISVDNLKPDGESTKSLFNESMNFLDKQLKNNNIHSNSSNDSSVRSTVSDKIELFTKMEKRKPLQRPPTPPPPIPVSASESNDDIKKESLRRTQSGRKSLNESGDILTKVAIPRSGSFLNAGGLTRYKSIGHRNNGKKGGGSPLGFHELFNEFKVQENLHSMDEILNAIIDAEGMSFNDLKPIYKEFLLKLAVTLTKDELFQHSKAIMKKQKKKILRKNSTVQNKRKKMLIGARGLKLVFRKPFGKDAKPKISKSESKKSKQKVYEFQSFGENPKALNPSESSVSTSSYDIRQFHPKEPSLPPPKRQSTKQRNSKRSESVHSRRSGRPLRPGERTSTSEDSDFLTNSGRVGCHRNSSSGYVSCSECDSESCVDRCYCSYKAQHKAKCYCSAVDVQPGVCKDDCKAKCYCSAVDTKTCKKVKTKTPKTDNIKRVDTRCFNSDCDYSWCECDSESCADSAKCYCATGLPPPPGRRAPHPPKLSTNKSSVKSSRSLEYISSPSERQYSARLQKAFNSSLYEPVRPKVRPSLDYRNSYREMSSRRCRAGDNLALDYEIYLINNGLKEAVQRRNMKRLTVRSTGAGGQDALSVKKSAEMAALFADVRLSQRTDVTSLLGSAASARHMFSSRNGLYTASYKHASLSRRTSLEDTLGYLP